MISVVRNLISNIKENIGWRWSRTGCCERYLGLRGRKQQEAGENCVTWSFMVCIPH